MSALKTPSRTSALALCTLVLALEWVAIAADYKDSVFLGTYHLEQGGESSTLTLRTDQTFQQEVTRDGVLQWAHGRWRRTGEGTIAFSREFLPVAGQELGADGVPYGMLEKSVGVFPVIALARQDVLWYSRTDTYRGSLIAGSYAGEQEGVPATLVVRGNGTFEQAVTRAGKTSHAHGTWNARDDGHLLFSRDFLKASGEPLTGAETASAWKSDGVNLQVVIVADPSSAQPVYKKRLLSY